MSNLLELFVPEAAPGDIDYNLEVRVCNRVNKLNELAYCLGKTYKQVADQARGLIRPADHPYGRQYLTDAVNELYAEYKVGAPHIFEQAKRPFLSSILGQVRTLADGGNS